MVARGRLLSDLSTLVPGLERRWHRRPPDHGPPRPPERRHAEVTGDRAIWLSFYRSRWPTSVRRLGLSRRRPDVRRPRRVRPPAREAHRRKIRVSSPGPGHTSDQHRGFLRPLVARGSQRDSSLGGCAPRRRAAEQLARRLQRVGSAWTLDQNRASIHPHFLSEQTDLNWWNPKVRAEIDDVMRFGSIAASRVPHDVASGSPGRAAPEQPALPLPRWPRRRHWDLEEVHDIHRNGGRSRLVNGDRYGRRRDRRARPPAARAVLRQRRRAAALLNFHFLEQPWVPSASAASSRNGSASCPITRGPTTPFEPRSIAGGVALRTGRAASRR